MSLSIEGAIKPNATQAVPLPGAMLATTALSLAGLPRRLAIFYLGLCLATMVVYGIAWRDVMKPSADTTAYLELAKDLRNFRLERLHDRSPGYPLLLVAAGATEGPTRALFFISLLLHVAAVWLLACALRVAGASERSLMAFGLLLCLPPYVQSAASMLTENLAQFTLACGVAMLAWWFERRRMVYLLIAAAAIAYCGLTRPAFQAWAIAIALTALPLACLLGGLRWQQAVKAGGVLTFVSVALLGGYSLVNYLRFDYFGVTPLLGYNLSTRTVHWWERLPNDQQGVRAALLRARDAELTEAGSSHTGYQAIWNARPEIERITGLPPAAQAKFMLRLNLGLIRQAPLSYLQEVGRSLGGAYWFPASNKLGNLNSGAAQLLWAALHFAIVTVFFGSLVLLIGAAAERRGGGPILRLPQLSPAAMTQMFVYVLAVMTVFYSMAISCAVDVGDARQRQPTDGLILLLAFLGPQLWRRMVKDRTVLAVRPSSQ